MKLSTETLNVLKNFASINQGIQFKKGKQLKTMSGGKSVLAKAGIKDEVPEDFCIYDLNQFLSVNSLFKDSAELDFDDANVIFKSGRKKMAYRKTDKSMITVPPEKDLNIVDPECSFTLNEEDYKWISDTAKVLSSPHIAIQSDGTKAELITFDADDDSAHTNSIEISEGRWPNGKPFKIVFSAANIKMIPGHYDVQVSFKGISHFKNTKDDIEYWVASESKYSKV
jgi:hypothetical protein